jgi:cytochrome P450
VQALFTAREVVNLLPIQNAEATQTTYDLIRSPENYNEHIQRFTTAVILASVFGQRGERFNSPKVQALYDVQNRFTGILEPGAAPPVDALTFLKYWPERFAPWKKAAKNIRKDQRALYFQLLEETKERMRERRGTGCFMESLIHNQPKSGLDDEHIAYIGGILMEAGSDTTSSTLLSFLLGVLQNPTALKRAQEEVDQLCGTKRSPMPEDIENMPYIEACMTEVSETAVRFFPDCLSNGDFLDAPLAPCCGRWHSSHADPNRQVQKFCVSGGDNVLRQYVGYSSR